MVYSLTLSEATDVVLRRLRLGGCTCEPDLMFTDAAGNIIADPEEEVPAGVLTTVDVFHDGWCPVLVSMRVN